MDKERLHVFSLYGKLFHTRTPVNLRNFFAKRKTQIISISLSYISSAYIWERMYAPRNMDIRHMLIKFSMYIISKNITTSWMHDISMQNQSLTFSVNMKITKMESWDSTYFQLRLKWYSALYLPPHRDLGRDILIPHPLICQSVYVYVALHLLMLCRLIQKLVHTLIEPIINMCIAKTYFN